MRNSCSKLAELKVQSRTDCVWPDGSHIRIGAPWQKLGVTLHVGNGLHAQCSWYVRLEPVSERALGAPAAEQYVHRLGRTARAGKSGRGTIVLLEDEKFFLSQVSRLKIPQAPVPEPCHSYKGLNPEEAMQKVSRATKSMAYSAWMGYYNGLCSKMRWSKPHLVSQANVFATDSLACREVPSIPAKTVGKMGLKGTPGLNVEKGPSGVPGGRGGGGGVPVSRRRCGGGAGRVDPKAAATSTVPDMSRGPQPPHVAAGTPCSGVASEAQLSSRLALCVW